MNILRHTGENELIQLAPLVEEYLELVRNCKEVGSKLSEISECGESCMLCDTYMPLYEKSFNCEFMRWLLNKYEFKKAAEVLLKKIPIENNDPEIKEAKKNIFARLVAIVFCYIIDLLTQNNPTIMMNRLTPAQKTHDKKEFEKFISHNKKRVFDHYPPFKRRLESLMEEAEKIVSCLDEKVIRKTSSCRYRDLMTELLITILVNYYGNLISKTCIANVTFLITSIIFNDQNPSRKRYMIKLVNDIDLKLKKYEGCVFCLLPTNINNYYYIY